MKNLFCNDIDGRILSVGDKVVVLDNEDIEYDVPSRGDVLRVTKLVDAESNYMEYSDEFGKFYGFFGHRILKLNNQ